MNTIYRGVDAAAKNVGTIFNKANRLKLLKPESPYAVKEAYNSLRAKLFFTARGDICPTYICTSATASEGKTINTINIAISFAQLGKKTLIIDADMRNPSMHKYFGVRAESGLSEILAGIEKEVNVRSTRQENLFLLPSGSLPPNSAELLSTKQVDTLLNFVREHFDYVFIDTPPVGICSDAMMLAGEATGYLFMVRLGTSEIPMLKMAIDRLQNMGATVSGIILNDVDGRGAAYMKKGGQYSYRYNYRYDHSYGEEEKDRKHK